MNTDWDIVIIGCGPAGLTAAQYAARADMKTVVLEQLSPGGQALLISDLENYPGFPEKTDGFSLAEAMTRQAQKFGAVIEYTGALSVKKEKDRFFIATGSGQIITAKAVILATGAAHRPLNVPGEERLSGRGVSYCATCDGPFFKGKKIFVVGGGDTACTEAAYLAHLSDHVTVVHRKDRFRAQKAVADKVLNHPNIRVLFNTEIKEIKGEEKVTSVILCDNRNQSITEESADAVFVFVGTAPHTEPVPEIQKDEAGYILTDASMETSLPGLFCAGDVRSTPFRQVVVACGEGAVAAHAAEKYIEKLTGNEYR